MIKVHQAISQLYVYEKIREWTFKAKNNNALKVGRCPPQYMFDANHFHIEATLDTTDSAEWTNM